MTSNQCPSCKHYRVGLLACDAFPDGIPYEVISGQHDHTKPYEGDNGIRFDPLPAPTKK